MQLTAWPKICKSLQIIGNFTIKILTLGSYESMHSLKPSNCQIPMYNLCK